jgi:acetyl-CoA carboxylase biotin carboxyl carrier protein
MPLSDEDVREILRIIDESPLDELRLETPEFKLHVRKGAGGDTFSGLPVASGAGQEVVPPPPPHVDGHLMIEAPMLGTFYRAEGPGQEPLVDVGSKVEPHTIVCIIEVMKMMNSVPAGVAGTVVEVCAENAQLVEYGAPIFRVDPA